MTKIKFTSYVVGAVFSAGGLYLAFRNVPLASLRDYAVQVNYLWTLPAALSLVLAYWVRSVRWQWLLLPTGRIKLTSAYHSIVISMMINCLLPGRAGELARPVVLNKQEDTPIAASLATLGVERVLDLLALLILLLPTLMTLAPDSEQPVTFGERQLTRSLLVDLGVGSLLAAIAMILLIYAIGNDALRARIIQWVRWWPPVMRRLKLQRISDLLERVIPSLGDLLERCAPGVKYICHLEGLLRATLSSLFFWTFSGLTFYFLSKGSPGMNLSFWDSCGVMVVICFFIALPSVPGFWGLWEAAGVFFLSFHG